MLVIRRRPGESLVIGEDVEIEILDSTRSHVKLGIRAPKSVVVLRKEIQVVGQQNRTASMEISGHAAKKLLASLKNSTLKPISHS
jgi:carbon storage regulator